MTTYAFLNAGRGVGPAPVRAAFAEIADRFRPNAVVVLAEIGEGDKGYDDHALVREAFVGWRQVHMTTREPILLSGHRDVTGIRSTRAGHGVTRQGPARPVNELVVGREDREQQTAVITAHPHAGVHNGHRPVSVKAKLAVEYLRTLAVLRARIRLHLKVGRNVVVAGDMNWRRMPPLHRRQVVIERKGPDYLIAIAGRGHNIKVGRHGVLPGRIEKLHGCLWADITFPAKKETRR